MNIFIKNNTDSWGPISEEKFHQLLKYNKLDNAKYWEAGMADWQPIEQSIYFQNYYDNINRLKQVRRNRLIFLVSAIFLLIISFLIYKTVFHKHYLKTFYYNYNEYLMAEGLLPVNHDGLYGYVDEEMNIKIPLIYEYANSFHDGFAQVKLNGKWGFINKKNELVIPNLYEEVRIFDEGLAAVKLNNKWGFINKNNEIVIKTFYEEVGNFSEGLCTAKDQGNSWGYIDKKGNRITLFNYEEVDPFKDGKAKVTSSGDTFFIDKTGKCIEDCPIRMNENYKATNNNFDTGIDELFEEAKRKKSQTFESINIFPQHEKRLHKFIYIVITVSRFNRVEYVNGLEFPIYEKGYYISEIIELSEYNNDIKNKLIDDFETLNVSWDISFHQDYKNEVLNRKVYEFNSYSDASEHKRRNFK